MIAAISGAGGLIGQSLTRTLRGRGWTIVPVTRNSFQTDDPELLKQVAEQADAVINLAGAPVSVKWTEVSKKEIRDSRILTTRKLADSIMAAQHKPKVFISASAIGIYDTTHIHDETSTGFSADFLGSVCGEWEAEANRVAGVTRTVLIRMGIVLSNKGGVLEKMRLPFSIGLGGKIGKGTQPVSFIHIDDLVNAFLFILEHDEISGPVNAVSPYPSTNREFTEKLGRVLKQPAFLTIPPFLLRMKFGEGASVLLEGQRVLPAKLEKAGFQWKYPTIQNSLVHLFR